MSFARLNKRLENKRGEKLFLFISNLRVISTITHSPELFANNASQGRKRVYIRDDVNRTSPQTTVERRRMGKVAAGKRCRARKKECKGAQEG